MSGLIGKRTLTELGKAGIKQVRYTWEGPSEVKRRVK